MPLSGLNVYGKSSQVTTTGSQLLDVNDDNKTNMIIESSNNGYIIKVSSTIKTDASSTNLIYVNAIYNTDYLIGKTVTMSYDDWTNDISDETVIFGFLYIIGGVPKYEHLFKPNKTKTVTIPSEATECKFRIFLVENASTTVKAGTYSATIKGLMVCEGPTAKSWEPYTGMQPSPSPDYPQEIVNTGNDGAVNVVLRGKNLLKVLCKNNANGLNAIQNSDGSITVSGTPTKAWSNITELEYTQCLPKGNYIFSINEPTSIIIGIKHDRTKELDGDSYGTYRVRAGETKCQYTRQYDSTYLSLFLEGLEIGKQYNFTLYLMLSNSDVNDYSYESHYEPQTLTIETPNGLPGIQVSSGGNYTDDTGQQWVCDEVDFEHGVYVQRVNKLNLFDLTWKYEQSPTYKNDVFIADINATGIDQGYSLCNFAIYDTVLYDYNQKCIARCYVCKNNVTISFKNSYGINSTEKFIQFLNNENDNSISYCLADPIEIPLTSNQITAYKNLRTYDGTTVIETSDNVGLNATYERKIKMANTTLKTRIILNNKTTDEWASNSTFVGLKGEFLVDTSTRKIKIGDGATTYADLPFANLTPEEVKSMIDAAVGAVHTHSNKAVLDATSASFTTDLLTKLNGIATGANKTTVDSALSSTSTNPVQNKIVNSALGGKVPTSRKINNKALTADITLSASDVGAIATSAKGAANGVASLDASGKVPSSQLPSFVDDVLEGYIADDAATFYKDAEKTSAYTPETGKIYVNLTNNKTYRYSGSKYIVISETIALGETSSTAYRGDRGKTAYDHAVSAHAPSNAERNIIVGIQKNGTDVTVDSSTRKVNITVPTKTSEITNDSGYITSGATVAKANQLTNTRKIDGVNFNGTADITHYGTCATAAATQAKVVDVSGFNLVTGARVTVKFTVTNTAASPTLNVNGTGAKAIKYRGSAIGAGYLAANRVYEFVYDGTDYLFMGDINTDTNTTYTAGAGLSLSGNQFKHSNAVTAGTAKGDDNKTLTFGGTFTIPSVTYDAQGHITAKGTTTMTMPATPTSVSGNAGSATKLATARNFSITGGATAAAVSFNGTANVALNVTALDAAKLTIASSDTLILDGSI